MLDKFNTKKGAVKYRSFFIFSFVFLAFISLVINHNSYDKKSERVSRFAWPAELIEHLVLGYKLPISDFFWLRFIQDIGYKDLNVDGKKTHKGWGYRMVDAITNLDPRYRIVYIAAGTILSVEVEDIEGARLVMEKGVKNLPTDWSLLYRLGYHYLYEVKDCAKAAKYLNEAGKYGAPHWVASLAARLYTASAQYAVAYSVIIDSLKRFEGTSMEPILLQRKKDLELAMEGIKVNPDHPSSKLCH